MESAARQLAALGRPPPRELAGPPLPPGAARLWDGFLDLSAHRGFGAWGDPLPLTHAAVHAWRELLAVPLQPADAALLLELDRLQRRTEAEHHATAGKPGAAGDAYPVPDSEF